MIKSLSLGEMMIRHFLKRLSSKWEVTGRHSDLIPGDIVEITQNLEIPADMILIEGTCVINETMLTGESTPVIKTSINKRSKVKIGKRCLNLL
jgi:P-type E1-E2 ATPase